MGKIKIYSLFAALMLLFPFLSSAQAPQPDNYLLSPTMASLGEYGEVPVSLYTGIPDISIPVYEAKIGEHKIPVSMSYHGGGVKPDQHPGWVGMGWTLRAGGSIMRVVHGKPDESDYYNVRSGSDKYDFQRRNMGWFFDNRNGSMSLIVEPEYQDLVKDLEPGYNLDDLRYALYDHEADEFMFDFLGFSGKFYYTADKGWIVNSNQFIKVIFDVNDESNYTRVFPDYIYNEDYNLARSQSINNFKLIDSSGNEYLFGGVDNPESIEYSVGFFSQHNEEIAASAWHLTQINYADGRTVKFNYQKKEFIAEMTISEEYTTSSIVGITTPEKVASYNGIDVSKAPSNGTDYIFGSLISPSYLSRIDLGAYGSISFDIAQTDELRYPMERACMEHYRRSNNKYAELIYLQHYGADGQRNIRYQNSLQCLNLLQWYKLTDIKVNSSTGDTLHHYVLHYNDEDTERAGKERLALLSFEESNGGKYSFEYNNIDKLPDYCSYNIDHWGFYANTGIATVVNQQIGNTTDTYTRRSVLITNTDRFTTSRNPQPQYSRYGSLEKINYPTGGYTRFEFEPHSYSAKVNFTRQSVDSLSSDVYAGGLRVKKVFTYDGVSNNGKEQLMKEYKYYDAVNQSGNLSSGILLTDGYYYFSTPANTSPLASSKTEVFTSQSNNAVGINADGYHIGYTYVTEVYPDNSMSVHRFSSYSDNLCQDVGGLSNTGYRLFRPYTSYSYKRGNLVWKKDYDADSNLTMKTEYEYDLLNSDVIQCMKQLVTFKEKYYMIDYYLYGVLAYSLTPSLITQTEYIDGVETASSGVGYTYDIRYKLLSRLNMYNNGVLRSQTDYTYPFNLYDTSSLAKKMTDKFMLSKVLTESIYRYDFDGTKYHVSTSNAKYADYNFISPIEMEQKIADKPSMNHYTFKYGKFYNPIYQNAVNGVQKTVYVWGYSHSNIVAVVQNATVEDVEAIIGKLDDFGDKQIPDYSVLNTLRNNLPDASVTLYKHIPGVGISECINCDGTIIKYVYDSLGRLSALKDDNGNLLKRYEYNYAGKRLNYQ